jgi:hypothetical protein
MIPLIALGPSVLDFLMPKVSHGQEMGKADFQQLMNKTGSQKLGVSQEDALKLYGATVVAQGDDGKLVQGKVDRVQLTSDGVVLQINGRKFMSDQILKVLNQSQGNL